MARDIQDYDGQVTAPDSDYPHGRIKNNTGSNAGTRVNETSNGDIQQFFPKLMDKAGIIYNDLPDNEYNGNQFFEALTTATRRGINYEETTAGIALSPTFFERCIHITAGVGPYIMPEAAQSMQADIVSFINDTVGAISINRFGAPDTVNGGNSFSLVAGAKVEFILNQPNSAWVIKMRYEP